MSRNLIFFKTDVYLNKKTGRTGEINCWKLRCGAHVTYRTQFYEYAAHTPNIARICPTKTWEKSTSYENPLFCCLLDSPPRSRDDKDIPME